MGVWKAVMECTGHDTIPKDPIVLDIGPLGGALLNGVTDGYWEISQADLESGDAVEFYLIQVPTPTCIDKANGKDESCLVAGGCIGLDQLGKTEEYSTAYRSSIEPKWYKMI